MVGICGLTLGCLSAQENSHFAFSIGGGFTTPLGNTGRQLDYGWNVGGGAGFNFNSHVGALIDVNFNSFGINSATLADFIGAFQGRRSRIFRHAPHFHIVHLTPHSPVDAYVTGGGGVYQQLPGIYPAGNRRGDGL